MIGARLAALQRPDGGFDSVVTSRRGQVVDCNGFTALLVVRTIRHTRTNRVIAAVRERALGFVARCASDEAAGAYAFWPAAMRPTWASSVPADVDDTAMALTEFVRYGWISRSEAISRIRTTLLPNRVTSRAAEAGPAWIVPGSFHTWIVPPSPLAMRAPNVVDCCVNANVVALMSYVGATYLPGYAEALQTIRSGITWAGTEPRRLSAITPFYPSVSSLVEAVRHAVECGAPLADAARDLSALDTAAYADAGYCCSAYGSTVWHSKAVDEARAA